MSNTARALLVLLIVIVGAFLLAMAITRADAKQEQVKPARPVPTVEKPIPAAKPCPPPMWVQFWVQDGNGGLKLVGEQIVEPRCATINLKLLP
ncbi:hypothetical protein [Rhizobium ruizarguesonis]|uniref:hypothetical protein n=1 Tax=Rhizobium ruizarguesonis TaxID=2081791 RepID=UPI00102F32CE|nr:hypothetical protein [Rhizobium ruizarguesonis]TBA16087.1 hypothetical protein ELH65_08960 [Rhizobium ruizarguesonis]